MTLADAVFLQVLEWLEPENVKRLMEISKQRGRPMSELIFVALRRSLVRRGATPEEMA